MRGLVRSGGEKSSACSFFQAVARVPTCGVRRALSLRTRFPSLGNPLCSPLLPPSPNHPLVPTKVVATLLREIRPPKLLVFLRVAGFVRWFVGTNSEA